MHARDAGQASIEYAGVVLLIAIVIALASAGAAGGPAAMGQQVTREFARALCVVSGGDCDRDRLPCTLSSTRIRDEVHASAFVVRISREWMALVERRSDGRWVVTRAHSTGSGVDVGLGAGARGWLNGDDVAVGGEARAAALARVGGGSSWVLESPAQVRRLMRLLQRDRIASLQPAVLLELAARRRIGLPAPDQTFLEGGLETDVRLRWPALAKLGLKRLETGADAIAGVRLDRRNGRRTIYLRHARDLALEAGVRRAGSGEGDGAGEAALAVELDRAGRPVDLAFTLVGEYAASADLPPQAQAVAGHLAVPSGGRRLYEVEHHLDLSDPGNRAAAEALLRQPGPAAVRTLAGRLARGVVHARTYALRRTGFGADGHLAAGVKVGGGGSHEETTARLLAARTRGLDGNWAGRADCIAPS